MIGIPMAYLSRLVSKMPLLKDLALVYKRKALHKLGSSISILNGNLLIGDAKLFHSVTSSAKENIQSSLLKDDFSSGYEDCIVSVSSYHAYRGWDYN